MALWSLAVCLVLVQDPPTLESLESDKMAVASSSGFFADPGPIQKINEGVLTLVSLDKLKTGEDFSRASRLYSVLNWDFEDAREKYELTLVAFSLGDKLAATKLTFEWDTLQFSSGRPQRFGSMKLPAGFESNLFAVKMSPSSVVSTLGDQGAAIKAAASYANNKLLQDTVDADQKEREGNWMDHTEQEFIDIGKRDRQRFKTAKDCIEKRRAHTAQDFYNAALVLQHGEVADDFALAHELSLCSIVLGDNSNARWLAAASYDRMLRHLGHRQRFATQYNSSGLDREDETGTNDTMRKALNCPSLEEARKRIIK